MPLSACGTVAADLPYGVRDATLTGHGSPHVSRSSVEIQCRPDQWELVVVLSDVI